ncbi:MAG: Micromonas pusilla virus [Bacteroidota bacterium]|jgi:hypothetical protein
MSRFGWAFVNDVIIGTGSAGTGSAVDGLVNSVIVRSGGIVSGATNFLFDNSAQIGRLTGSLFVTQNLTVTGNLYTGPASITSLNATTYVSASSITGTLLSNTGNKFGSVVGDIHQFTGSISGSGVSGTLAQFTTISGSTITGSIGLFSSSTITSASISSITSTTNTTSILYVTGAANSIISGKRINTLGSFSVSPQINSVDPKPDIATAMYFKPDGSRVYVHDDTNNELLFASLTTPWSISSLQTPFTLVASNVPTSTAAHAANGLAFKPDGREAYILLNNRELYQKTLSTPWEFDVTSWTRRVTLSGSAGVLGEQKSLIFSENGDYLFTCTGSTVVRYALPTPWAASSIVHTSYTTASTGVSNIKAISLTNDGKSLLLLDTSNIIYDFELDNVYDLTRITQKSTVSLNSLTTLSGLPYNITTGSMYLKPDSTKIFFNTLSGSSQSYISSLTMTSSQVDLVGAIHITGDAKIAQNIDVYGDATFEDLSGSNGQFRILSGSTVTGSNALFTTISGSTVTGSAALFTTISASVITASVGISASQGQFAQLTASSIAGNSATATKLATARNINGTAFDGTADITTTNWGTARTITIGNTGKAVNGSTTYSWTLSEIGAAGTGVSNTYTSTNTFGGGVTGSITGSDAKFTTLSGSITGSDGRFGILSASSADINGGTIDNATIATSNITVGSGKTLNVSAGTLTLNAGQVTADKVGGGTFNIGSYSFNGSTVSYDNIDINGGAIDSTPIGASGQQSGKFTTLSASSTLDVVGKTAVTNLTASIGLSGSQGQFNQLTASLVDINGGKIDNTSIGSSIQSTGKFTTLSASSTLQVGGNVNMAGTLDVVGSFTSYIVTGDTIISNGNILGYGDVWANSGTGARLRKGSPSSTYYGLGIKQDANSDGGRYGITLEAAGSTAHWDIYVNSGNDLRFVYNNSTAYGGYFNNLIDVGALDFTGQHRNISDIDEQINTNEHNGLIVVSTGKYINSDMTTKPTINESLPTIKLSSNRNEKAVWGVVSDSEDPNELSREYRIGIFVSVIEKQNQNDNRVIVNSIGEGGIWVCNINGNLENGDYITTCEIPGHGMKQDDDLLHNYTVAKITQDCTFDLNNPNYDCVEFQFSGSTYRKAFVGCTYHCG